MMRTLIVTLSIIAISILPVKAYEWGTYIDDNESGQYSRDSERFVNRMMKDVMYIYENNLNSDPQVKDFQMNMTIEVSPVKAAEAIVFQYNVVDVELAGGTEYEDAQDNEDTKDYYDTDEELDIEDTVEDNKSGKKSSSSGLFGYLLALLVGAGGGFGVAKYLSNVQEAKRRRIEEERLKAEAKKREEERRIALEAQKRLAEQERIRKAEEEARLAKQREEDARRQQQAHNYAETPVDTYHPSNTTVIPPKPKSIKRYGQISIPGSNELLIEEDYLNDSPVNQPFAFEFTADMSSGKYDLTDSAHREFVKDTAFIQPFVNDFMANPQAQRIVTIKPGTFRRTAYGWEVTEKLTIELK